MCSHSLRWPRARRGRGLLLTALAVALSLLATAVVWLPSFLEYLQSGRTVDLLSSVSSGSFTAPLPTTLPVLLCTALAVGAPVFFFSGRSRAKGLWCVFVLFLLMLLPLLIDPINRMWHLGSYQAFPARYGFIPVFLGLLIAAWYLAQTERLLGAGFVPKRRRAFDWVLPAAAAALLFALAWRFLSDALLREELSEYVRTLWGDTDSLKLEALFAACALCGFLLLFLLYRGRRLAKPAFCVLLCALTLVEGFFHMDLYIGQAGGDSTAYKNVLDLADRVDDDSLYRVKLDEKYFDANLLGGLGYNALSHYTSLTGETALNAMKWLGYSSYWMEIGSNGGTALTDALLAQKYTIALRGTEDGREVLYQNGDYSIVKTPYTLPFGVVTQSLGEALADGDRFQMQQMLFESVFGIDEPLFTRFSPIEERGAHVKTDKGGTTKVTGAGGRLFYSITVSKKMILYLDCFDEATTDLSRPTYDAFRVTVNGRTITPSYPKDSQNGILELGTFEPGQVVDITLDLHHDITCSSFGVAGLDVGLLEKALASASCADLSQQGNTLSGTVDAKASGWLLLPIPAEAGLYGHRQRRTVRGRNGVRLPFGRQSPGRRLRSDALIYAARLCRGACALGTRRRATCLFPSGTAARVAFKALVSRKTGHGLVRRSRIFGGGCPVRVPGGRLLDGPSPALMIKTVGAASSFEAAPFCCRKCEKGLLAAFQIYQ